jgi:hypothetical protein
MGPKRRRLLMGASIAAVLGLAVAAGWSLGLGPQISPLLSDTRTVAPNVPPPPTAASTPSAPLASLVAAPAPRPVDPEMVFRQTIAASNTAQFSGFARNRIAGLAPAAIAMAADVSRILKCEGPFARNSSHARLVQTFGQQNVREGNIHLGEGESSPGSIIYPNDPQIKIEITWKDTVKFEKINWLYIRKNSKWRLVNGMKIGSSLKDVERLNGRPFKLSGFGWDYSGAVRSWRDGSLDTALGDCAVSARFDPAENLPAQVTKKLLGDREILSSNRDMQATRPAIYLLLVGYR